METNTTRSENQENESWSRTRQYHSRVRQKGIKKCYMHNVSIARQEKVQGFTEKRWSTYRKSVRRWLPLLGESRELADMYRHCVDVEFDHAPQDAGFHPACYTRFTDIHRMASAEKRIARLAAGTLSRRE